MIEIIEKKLLANRVRPSGQAFAFLRREIQLCVEGVLSANRIVKVHERVAEEFGTTWNNVNVSIQRAFKRVGIDEYVSDFVARLTLEVKWELGK